MKKPVYILFVFITVLQLHNCAPASHVRVGVKMNVPTVWSGSYPYSVPDSTVMMGRPASDELPQLEK